MLTCREAIEHWLDFLEGGLGPELAASLDAHVRHCLWCQRFVMSYQKTIVLCRRVAEVQRPPDGAVEQVLAKMHELLHMQSDSR